MREKPPNFDNFPAGESILLRRAVRFGISLNGTADTQGSGVVAGSGNGFAGIPPSDGWTAHHEVEVECQGTPDPVTGYLIGIQEIDAAVRARLRPLLASLLASRDRATPSCAVGLLARSLEGTLPPTAVVTELAWRPGPFITHTWRRTMPDHAILAERFEFSAAHRLHCPDLSDEENRKTFGKCNHPSGHGHNYRVEVAVLVGTGAGAAPFTSATLESVVNRVVIDRFDHKHLNVDCPEFERLNPSVENIARVCHALLSPATEAAGAALHRVTVWETEKTSATFPVR
jgi:6-pyruvoyltetrahydropterin/6-carboxytetrahydropterin synthase